VANPIILGSFVFDGFEIPEHVPLGGSQRTATHELLGGARVVEALGASERDITWSGRFQGAFAWQRARALDAMRIAGQPLPLIVDTEFRTVLITEFHPNYERAYQVPYSITCLVINNPAAFDGSLGSLDTVIAADLLAAASLVTSFLSF
jgi:hypothetical protein